MEDPNFQLPLENEPEEQRNHEQSPEELAKANHEESLIALELIMEELDGMREGRISRDEDRLIYLMGQEVEKRKQISACKSELDEFERVRQAADPDHMNKQLERDEQASKMFGAKRNRLTS